MSREHEPQTTLNNRTFTTDGCNEVRWTAGILQHHTHSSGKVLKSCQNVLSPSLPKTTVVAGLLGFSGIRRSCQKKTIGQVFPK